MMPVSVSGTVSGILLMLPVMERALANVNRLLAESQDNSIAQALKVTAANWERQQTFMQSELGDVYNRLRRAIQRWCVDACTEYGWEIPFPQMTLHGAVARAE